MAALENQLDRLLWAPVDPSPPRPRSPPAQFVQMNHSERGPVKPEGQQWGALLAV